MSLSHTSGRLLVIPGPVSQKIGLDSHCQHGEGDKKGAPPCQLFLSQGGAGLGRSVHELGAPSVH